MFLFADVLHQNFVCSLQVSDGQAWPEAWQDPDGGSQEHDGWNISVLGKRTGLFNSFQWNIFCPFSSSLGNNINFSLPIWSHILFLQHNWRYLSFQLQFVSAYEKLDSFFTMNALVRLSKHVLSAQDTGSFLAISLGTVLVQVSAPLN